MFSELCRETLRKAAVCYNTSGRPGSPSTSPPTSPPSSPAKEAKTTANVELANIDRSSGQGTPSSTNQHPQQQQQQRHQRHHQQQQQSHDHSGYSTERPATNEHLHQQQQHQQSTAFRSKISSTGVRRSNLIEQKTHVSSVDQDKIKKRRAMPTDFGKGSRDYQRRERRRSSHSMSDDYRTEGWNSSIITRSSSSTLSSSGYWDREWYLFGHENYNNRTRDHSRSRSESSGSSTDDNASTSGDEAGAAPEESNQRSSSAHHRHSLTKDVKRRSIFDEDSLDGDHHNDNQVRDGTSSGKDVDRAKLVRDRQNEERQRKLEELRQQALAAQLFREQREAERRRRIDELRSRDSDRRNQVEERKRLIWEAEQERREAILRKNQEREARIEARKRNERSHIVFAFGSSTPRMLEPADTGGSTFWGTRRATSTTNVMMFPTGQPLTRRSSERELDGSKKRATSAGGLDRKPGEDMRMSSSMYEVFNWNSNPDPSLIHVKHNKRASLSLPPTTTTDILAIDDKSDNEARRSGMQRAYTGDDSDGTGGAGAGGAAGTPTSSMYLRVNRRRTDLMPTIPSPREVGGSPGQTRSSSLKAFTRSPGRTYSMSRLDQLAQPRRRNAAGGVVFELGTLDEDRGRPRNGGPIGEQQHPQQRQPLGAGSMSRSMSHLAAPGASLKNPLKRTDNSRSMVTLPGAPALQSCARPRTTRAERLRRKAREHQTQQGLGVRSGEVTPNSPSRPHSSMSQHSASSSVGSGNVVLRSRATTTTPRRPRPASIAGTGVSVAERHNPTGETKITKDSKPPLPKSYHSTPKKPKTTLSTATATTTTVTTTTTTTTGTPTTPTSKITDSGKKHTEKLIRSARASPRVTPKATPLQSPGAENHPLIRETTSEIIKQNSVKEAKIAAKNEEKNEEKKDLGTEKNQISEEPVDSKEANTKATAATDIAREITNVPTAEKIAPDESIVEKVDDKASTHGDGETIVNNDKQEANNTEDNKSASSDPPEVKTDLDLEEIDMSASMIAKTRITTEEEAKAALAERRRLAREQAEREAELERQRLEEEARLELERQRAEEEEQRRLEVETLRLANEARESEEQRLRLAIEEAKKREEEDRKRREEEARQKIEKEEAERKAREEAEKQRLEMVERLKKEEEERLQRRKRVEAIMLRTRGKNQPNTPTKGDAMNVSVGSVGSGGDSNSDKLKEESPSDENKLLAEENCSKSGGDDDVMTASLISEAAEQLINSEQQANHDANNSEIGIVRNGTNHRNGINESKTLLENDRPDNNGETELNGHHTNHGNGILNSQSITLDNDTVKQNNVTNNLLDLTDFDSLSNSGTRGQILEISSNLSNEDSLNSNLNPSAIPFIPMVDPFALPVAANANTNPFQDVFTTNTTNTNATNNKTQDNNQLPDLLS